MSATAKMLSASAAVLFTSAHLVAADERTFDPETGFALDANWEVVKQNCTQCHSSKLVVQTLANRETWLEMIRWMQRTQNLWPFPPETEAQILDYLATHYAPTESRARRAPLNAALMPPPQTSTEREPDAESNR